jgi:hypothetical protein
MNFYVYDRGEPRVIASIEQLKADPTLAGDAVKENRACPGFLLCGDNVRTFSNANGWQDLGDFPEGKKYTPVINEPFGGIVLRRGESYIRTWMPGEHWYQKGWPKKGEGPRHGCARVDRKDAVNWPLYEPHEWQGKSRHWGAGRLVYAPDLKSDHWTDAAMEKTNLVGGKEGLAPAEADKAGEVVFAVNCPYVITAGELKLSASGESKVAATVSRDQGKTWQALALTNAGGVAKCLFRDEVDGCFEGYWLRLTIPAGTAVTGMELTSHFELVPFSLPYLVPGKNTVSVEAESFGAPLTVIWDYAEGIDWKDSRSATRTFEQNGSFEIEAVGPKYPRMVALTLKVAP